MKRNIIICLVITLLVPILLSANFNYLSEDDYKKLNKREREAYINNLQAEMTNLQQRKSDAVAKNEDNEKKIAETKAKINSTDQEYQDVYARVLKGLGLTASDVAAAKRKLDQLERNIDNWNTLSDSELWNNAKAIKQTINEYNDFNNTSVSKAPDFRDNIVEINRKIVNLERNLERARPKYYEDDYKVVRGDYLSKIAGYSFIYNDASKWGIIYRANRDQIKDPNIISVDQVLKIPRGLPNTWKVYRGECLWRIAAYPEVYGKGIEWPRIYRANQDQIKDPDLIFPNQVFTIPRD